MPSIVASFIYLSGVAWLFRRDFRERPNVTAALWLPFFWVFISGSRFVSQWLAMFGLNLGGSSVEEGSPVDAIFFFGIIGAGLYVLHQRRVSLAEFMRNNQWVTIYLAYCFLAIVWSDYPLVAFKRWIKLFGQPVMVLIVLTEPDPMEALTRLFKRCAYVWVPVSILFIKYYPEWGRGFSVWTGESTNCGITLGKNLLGVDCMILGLFFFWHFLRVRKQEKSSAKRNELILGLAFLAMIGWLLHVAQSSTSLVSMLVAIGVVLFLGLRFVRVERIGIYLVAIVVTCVLAEAMFGIHDLVIGSLGKDSTLTGRTDIWQILLNWEINPVLGTGFESFWLGDRIKKLDALYPEIHLNEAHNGYLETYLNLGLLGLAITLGIVVATYAKGRKALINDFQFGRFRLAYLIAFVIYNWTEAAFRTHCVPFFVFFLCAIDYPTRVQPAAATAEVVNEHEPDSSPAGCPQNIRPTDDSLVENANPSYDKKATKG
jgi:exopolysaccharide production protein ExoQ